MPGPNDTNSPLTTQLEGSPTQFAWTFVRADGSNWEPMVSTMWTYTQTPVPLPPSVFLLGAGLIGLAVARRKKRLGQ